MIKSAKTASSQEEELDDEEDFVVKKEISPAPRGIFLLLNSYDSS